MTPEEKRAYFGEFFKNRKLATRSIAKIAMREYPSIFTNYETVRSIVRYYRGEHNNSQKKDINMNFRTEDERENAKSSKWRTTEYEEVSPYILPETSKKVGIISDVHFPYQDQNGLEMTLEYFYKVGIDTLYMNGDILDMYKASRFTKDPRLTSVKDEFHIGYAFMEEMTKNFENVVFKAGNHEKRFEDYLKNKAPEIFGIADFFLDRVMKLDELGITYVKDTQAAYFGKLLVLHGHEFGHSVFSPVNPARGLFLRAKTSSLIGHHHQSSEHSEKDANGKVTTCFSTGCLCGLKPEYFPYNKWNLGFAVVDVDGKEFEVDNKKIIKGKIR